jgi:ElaB/YqjD/DUF883 family membrane-anchored ribosome-binding protein
MSWKGERIMADTNDIRSHVENAVSQASEQAQQAAATALSKVQEMANTAGKKVEEAAAALGECVKSAGGTLRDRGPHQGMLSTATNTVADSLETTGRYIQEEGIRGMAHDLTDLIRRNPIPAMLVGVGIGFVLARMLRR